MDREVSLVALHLIPGTASLLRRYLEEEEKTMHASPATRESSTRYDARASDLMEQAKLSQAKAQDIVAEFKNRGVSVLASNDACYPVGLKKVGSFPPLLYVMGNTDVLGKHSVAICGSRHASPDGLGHAQTFGRVAAESGLCVVSGYAKGVDTCAHLGALDVYGSTVIVLAEGILNFRLKRDFRSVQRFWDNVVVVSQFPPEQPWTVYAAMERNRVICGLARGLVVVEAHDRGGTLAAGRECLRQKKPLWVMQHALPRDDCAGNRVLLNEGGIGVRTIRDLRSALSSLSRATLLSLREEL